MKKTVETEDNGVKVRVELVDDELQKVVIDDAVYLDRDQAQALYEVLEEVCT